MLYSKGLYFIFLFSIPLAAMKQDAEKLRLGLFQAAQRNPVDPDYSGSLQSPLQAAQRFSRKLAPFSLDTASHAEQELARNVAFALHYISMQLVHSELVRDADQKHRQRWLALAMHNDLMRALALTRRNDVKDQAAVHPHAHALEAIRKSLELPELQRGLTRSERLVETAATVHGSLGVLTAHPSLATVNLAVLQSSFVQTTITKNLPHIGLMLSRLQSLGLHPLQLMDKAAALKAATPSSVAAMIGLLVRPIRWGGWQFFSGTGWLINRAQRWQNIEEEALQSPLAPTLVDVGRSDAASLRAAVFTHDCIHESAAQGISLLDSPPPLLPTSEQAARERVALIDASLASERDNDHRLILKRERDYLVDYYGLHTKSRPVLLKDSLAKIKKERALIQAELNAKPNFLLLNSFFGWMARQQDLPKNPREKLEEQDEKLAKKEEELRRLALYFQNGSSGWYDSKFISSLVLPEHQALAAYAEGLLPLFRPLILRARLEKYHLFEELSDPDLFMLLVRSSLNKDTEEGALTEAHQQMENFAANTYLAQPGSAQMRIVQLAKHIDPIFWYCIPPEKRPVVN